MTTTECTCPSIAAAIFGPSTEENTCELHTQQPTQKSYVALNDGDGLAALLGIPRDDQVRHSIHRAINGEHRHAH